MSLLIVTWPFITPIGAQLHGGFLYEVSIPELDELLALDEVIDGCQLRSLYKELGIDPDDICNAAVEDDAISISYPDDRAREMFDRILSNYADDDALAELTEWSPGFGWDQALKLTSSASLQFGPCATGHDLLKAAYDRIGAERTHQRLEGLGLYGTMSLIRKRRGRLVCCDFRSISCRDHQCHRAGASFEG